MPWPLNRREGCWFFCFYSAVWSQCRSFEYAICMPWTTYHRSVQDGIAEKNAVQACKFVKYTVGTWLSDFNANIPEYSSKNSLTLRLEEENSTSVREYFKIRVAYSKNGPVISHTLIANPFFFLFFILFFILFSWLLFFFEMLVQKLTGVTCSGTGELHSREQKSIVSKVRLIERSVNEFRLLCC